MQGARQKTGIHQDPDSKFWDFDFHSWVDPWSQVYGEEYGFVPPDRTVTWVDIDSIALVLIDRIQYPCDNSSCQI